MTNNQIDPNQETNDNQLAEEELEEVAGGGIWGDIKDAVDDAYKDFADGGLRPD
jgi:hypothetical protein